MTTRLGIFGITGKIGGLCATTIGEDLVLMGGTGRPGGSRPVPAGTQLYPDAAALARDCDVVIDVTHAAAVTAHAQAVLQAGCAWVIGTSGIDVEGRAAIRNASASVPVLQAANFSLGMNLVLHLAERLGQLLPATEYDAEIVDIFHRRKVDAPSGTATAIGEAVARGRGVQLAQVREAGRNGHIGARGPGAIGFSSLRGGGVVGENTLTMTGSAEQTILTHRVNNPRVYARGALQAVRWIRGRPPGLYGMRDVVMGDEA